MPLKQELIHALVALGWTKPTEVQEQAIPVVLKGKDVVVRARTGSGKTGAFMIPITQMMHGRPTSPVTLVLAPTRELALQITQVATKICTPLGYRTVTVYGGASINVQIDALRRGATVVVGTPGRIIDLVERGALDLSQIKYLVLDEADTMLDMGFFDDVVYILDQTPEQRQTMLFSATMPHKIVSIANNYMKQAEQIIVGDEEQITATGITHYYAIASGGQKFAALIAYIKQYKPKKAIIFSMTQRGAETIHRVLRGEGLDAIMLHGGMTQAMRERSLKSFHGGAQYMISTNVAARGLDIKDISDIINFDAPDDPFVYIHRVGRSARMDKEGRAFTLFANDERRLVDLIMADANITMEEIKLDTSSITTDFRQYFARREHGRGPPRGGGGGGRPYGGRPRFGGGRGGGYDNRREGGNGAPHHGGGGGGRFIDRRRHGGGGWHDRERHL